MERIIEIPKGTTTKLSRDFARFTGLVSGLNEYLEQAREAIKVNDMRSAANWLVVANAARFNVHKELSNFVFMEAAPQYSGIALVYSEAIKIDIESLQLNLIEQMRKAA